VESLGTTCIRVAEIVGFIMILLFVVEFWTLSLALVLVVISTPGAAQNS
jgi:hypothetical protein